MGSLSGVLPHLAKAENAHDDARFAFFWNALSLGGGEEGEAKEEKKEKAVVIALHKAGSASDDAPRAGASSFPGHGTRKAGFPTKSTKPSRVAADQAAQQPSTSGQKMSEVQIVSAIPKKSRFHCSTASVSSIASDVS